MEYDFGYMERVLRNSGVELEPAEQDLLQNYVTLLLEWNSRVNLISRKDEQYVWRNHILHSLAALTVVDIPEGARVLDVGTGGGLPGIPMAILRPGAEFVLIDSVAKKMRAVSDMVQALGLQNVNTHTGRVEDLLRDNKHRARYNMVVSRAVARMETLLAWVGQLVAPGGRLVAWKGGTLEEEIRQAQSVHGLKTIEKVDFQLAGDDYFESEEKCLVVAEL